MDMIMDCFFDEVFSGMERDSLFARYRRRQMVEYLSTVIQGCSRAEGDPNNACKRAVTSALNFHQATKGKNGQVCLMGKYHNVLYVAARLAFDWNLDDSPTVAELLNAMYMCERTFDRLLTGAIFGPKASGVISGWKSDFDTREENIKALKYFMDHVSKEKKEFKTKGGHIRLVDVPMDSYGRSTPATVSVQVMRPDVLLLLLQYGAQPYTQDSHCPLEVLLKRLTDSHDLISPDLHKCLMIIMRVIIHIPRHYEDGHPYIEAYLPALRFIPPQRYKIPADLKHQCRIKIRTVLNSNYQLPLGISLLPLPESLQQYVNLEND